MRFREENKNTKEFWKGKHGKKLNASISTQFQRFFDWIPTGENISVLDVGFGDADHFRDYSSYPIEWHGLDFVEECIDRAKGVYPGATYHLIDINTEEIPGVYDYVVSMHTFEHFEDPVLALEKCLDACRRKVIICVPYKDAWGNAPGHLHKFYLDDPFTDYIEHKLFMGKEEAPEDTAKEIFYVFNGRAT